MGSGLSSVKGRVGVRVRVRVGRGVPARAVVVEVLVGPRGASPLAPGEHLLP